MKTITRFFSITIFLGFLHSAMCANIQLYNTADESYLKSYSIDDETDSLNLFNQSAFTYSTTSFDEEDDWDNGLGIGEEPIVPVGEEMLALSIFSSVYACVVMKRRKKRVGDKM
ncbi:MAG: hypothetical protein LBN27_04000 [Prevotellaceae bacterium]|jgi:hypothetical protein|nr:hypothetical protein [Prevotellaceae bacterium]